MDCNLFRLIIMFYVSNSIFFKLTHDKFTNFYVNTQIFLNIFSLLSVNMSTNTKESTPDCKLLLPKAVRGKGFAGNG